jgi:protein subunit release factor A
MTTPRVAPRPPPYALDRRVLAQEVTVETFRAAGAGGQHLHKTESAVRLRHGPSGVTVIASDTRSQARNRELAFERLIARLRRLNTPRKRRIATRPGTAARKRRLEQKQRQARKKSLRGRIAPE